jgi:hypothetical protein
MGTRIRSKDHAAKRIESKISQLSLKDIEIRDYVRDTDLTNLPGHAAYRADRAHPYADILNLIDMLHGTAVEGETCHRRIRRFLSFRYQGVYRVLRRVDALSADFSQPAPDEHSTARVAA